MIFDTHAHYYDEAFDADRDALLASLPGRGVALVVCPGCDPESSRQSIALAERYGFLYAAAGYHPENLEGAALSDLDAVKALCAHPKVVAVGEIGLDYYWLKTPEERANSRDFLRRPALPGGGAQPPRHRPRPGCPPGLPGHRPRPPRRPGGVPLLLRQPGGRQGAGGQGLDALLHRQHHLQERPPGPRHPPLAAPGPADAGDRRPYMAPEPYRGQRCDSTMIARSAETVAQLRGLTRDEVEAVTLENGKKFFGIA